ncbi:MAG: rRNA maturation RNase YbeY, partial [Deltaproteobacteria bacterium]|nr:rRNA maturation RNase YbeY [Deltaproteobacteria bacterium]
RQARERRVPLHRELTLLVTHGLLHLLGFDDETRAGWVMMRKHEFESLMRMV